MLASLIEYSWLRLCELTGCAWNHLLLVCICKSKLCIAYCYMYLGKCRKNDGI